MRRQLWRMLAGLILALAWLGSVWLGLMIAWRDPPIIYEAARAIEDRAPAGGTIDVEFEVFRTQICRSSGRRFLTDANGTQHAIQGYTVGSASKKGREVYRRTITIPLNAAVGPASYQVKIEFVCNPLQALGWPIKVESPPVRFTVEPATTLVPFGLPSSGD